jgi:hypothetical protein
MNRGNAGAHRAFADYEFATAGDERGVADLDPADIGNGVVGAGSTVERDAEIAGAGLGLSVHRELRGEREGEQCNWNLALGNI